MPVKWLNVATMRFNQIPDGTKFESFRSHKVDPQQHMIACAHSGKEAEECLHEEMGARERHGVSQEGIVIKRNGSFVDKEF